MTLGKENQEQQHQELNENKLFSTNLKTTDQLVSTEQLKFSPFNNEFNQSIYKRQIQESNQHQEPFVFGMSSNESKKEFIRFHSNQSGQERSPQNYFKNYDNQQFFKSQFEELSKQTSERQNDQGLDDLINIHQNNPSSDKRQLQSKFAGQISRLIGNKKHSIVLSASETGSNQMDQDVFSQKDQFSCINTDRRQFKHGSMGNLELDHFTGLHTIESPFQSSHQDRNYPQISHTEPENFTERQSLSIDTKSTFRRGPTLNEGKIKTLKHSHSQSEDMKSSNLDIQKQLEDRFLKQRRNGNFDRDNKRFIKKDPNRQVNSSHNIKIDNDDKLNEVEKKQNGEILKNVNKKSSFKKQLTKKVTIKDQPQKSEQQIANLDQQQPKQSSSKRIKSFFSTKTKEITGLIRFHIQQMQKQDTKQVNKQKTSNSSDCQQNDNDHKQNLERQKTHKQFDGIINQKSEKSIVLSLVDYVKYFFACFMDTPKVKQMKYTNKKVKKRLDIIYILEKLIEIDKLKVLLLNPDQINLFDYMPKEFVSQDIQEGENFDMFNKHNKFATWSLLCAERSSLDKISNACIAYHHIQQNSNKTKIDKKLIQMLDPQVKRYFNKTLIQPNDVKHYRSLQAHYSMDEEDITKQTDNQKDEILKQLDNLLNVQKSASIPNLQHQQTNFSRQSCFDKSNQNTFQWGLDSNVQRRNSLMSNFISPAHSSTENQSFQFLDKVSNTNNFYLPERQNDKKLSLISSQTLYTNSPKLEAKTQSLNTSAEIDTLAMNILKSKRSNYISQKSKIKTINYCCPIIEESNMLSSEKFGRSLSPRSVKNAQFSGLQFDDKKPSILQSRAQSIIIKNDEINKYISPINSQEQLRFESKIETPKTESELKKEQLKDDVIIFQEQEEFSQSQGSHISSTHTPKKNPQFFNEMLNFSNSKQINYTQDEDLDANLKKNTQLQNSLFISSNSKQNQTTQEEYFDENIKKNHNLFNSILNNIQQKQNQNTQEDQHDTHIQKVV